MKNWRKVLGVLTVITFSIFLGACSTDGDSAEGTLDIAYSFHDLSNPYFVTLADGFTEEAERNGFSTTVQDAKMDIAKQISTVENFITQGKDAIFITPADEKALEDVTRQATEAGIPVISMNLEIPGYTAFITPNEYEFGYAGGQIAGQWILDNLESDSDAKVAIFTAPEQPQLAERIRGLKEGLLELAPNAEIISEQGAINTESGLAAAETILQAHPDVNVILSNNDAAALGAFEAFKAANIQDIAIVGLDATTEAVNKVKEGGNFIGTVDIDPYGTGVQAVKVLEQVFDEERNITPVEEPIYVNIIPVTKENVDQY